MSRNRMPPPELAGAPEEVVRARDFAMRAHGGQQYGTLPYVAHLDEVYTILFRHGHTSALVVGYLHDVLEDTDVTLDALTNEFGADAAHAVAFCSDEPGNERSERKERTYARMKATIAENPSWLSVGICAKVADRLANSTASWRNNPRLFRTYKAEWPAFHDALFVKGTCDGMWQELRNVLCV